MGFLHSILEEKGSKGSLILKLHSKFLSMKIVSCTCQFPKRGQNNPLSSSYILQIVSYKTGFVHFSMLEESEASLTFNLYFKISPMKWVFLHFSMLEKELEGTYIFRSTPNYYPWNSFLVLINRQEAVKRIFNFATIFSIHISTKQ